jgi:hypothetical protein
MSTWSWILLLVFLDSLECISSEAGVERTPATSRFHNRMKNHLEVGSLKRTSPRAPGNMPTMDAVKSIHWRATHGRIFSN